MLTQRLVICRCESCFEFKIFPDSILSFSLSLTRLNSISFSSPHLIKFLRRLIFTIIPLVLMIRSRYPVQPLGFLSLSSSLARSSSRDHVFPNGERTAACIHHTRRQFAVGVGLMGYPACLNALANRFTLCVLYFFHFHHYSPDH